jgi:hypothetical protein
MVKILECGEASRFSMMTLRTNTTTCARLLAYVTGLVNQELLLQNEYLAAENRILKARLKPVSVAKTSFANEIKSLSSTWQPNVR